jgi:hypothetical protein
MQSLGRRLLVVGLAWGVAGLVGSSATAFGEGVAAGEGSGGSSSSSSSASPSLGEVCRPLGRCPRPHEVTTDAATPAELLELVRGKKYEAMFEVPRYSEGGCFF